MRPSAPRWSAMILTACLGFTAVGQPPTDRPPPDAPRPSRAAEVPPHIELVRDVVYATEQSDEGEPIELGMDVAFPKDSRESPLPVVVYIHGGGWTSGSRAAGLPFILAFADGGYFAVTIDYRLAGQARYPAAVNDCRSALAFLCSNAAELGIDAERIGVWGHSAGGHLSALIGTTSGAGAATTGCAPVCIADVSGPADLTSLGRNGRRSVSRWIPGEGEDLEQRLAEASPIRHIDANDPAFLLVHGREDRLVPIEQSRRFAAALEAGGVAVELLELEDAGHRVESREAYERIAAFMDRHLGGEAAAAMRDVAARRRDRRPRPEP